MVQVFPRSANIIARLSLLIGILLVGLGAALAIAAGGSFNPTVQGQPVPFSHHEHVGNLGIDCRYCHTTVETSPFAGMPSSQVCMNCHSEVLDSADELAPIRDSVENGTPIVWNRVYVVPDFVYFDHSAHVNKGVACVTCHGQVDQMPVIIQATSLQMGWCMSCHRNPAPNIRPRDQVFNMNWQPPEDLAQLTQELVADYNVQSKTSCSTCHR
jgi:NAD-dependent SIR2 family protein deacetylase